MPKPKWNLNTIYISERLQESLRPISRCAMTTVVAPMGRRRTTDRSTWRCAAIFGAAHLTVSLQSFRWRLLCVVIQKIQPGLDR